MWNVKKSNITISLKITIIVSFILALLTTCLVVIGIYSNNYNTNAFESQMSAIAINSVHVGEDGLISSVEVKPAEQAEVTIPANNIEENNKIVKVAIADLRSSINKQLIFGLIFINLVGIIITYFALKKAMQPLKTLSFEIAQIDENNLDYEFTNNYKDKEVKLVSDSFQNMIEKLKKSFQVQKNFAANAAHEFKTPLSVMKSSIQVLEMDKDPSKEDYRETIEICKVKVQQMSKIIEELLQVSNNISDNKEKINIKNMVNDILYQYKNQINEKQINVKNIIQIEEYKENKIILKFILDNLISNAVKYNRQKGDINIFISEENEKLKIQIEDTGIGINEEHLPYIFESFYRVDQSRNKEIDGNGLGLQIVKNSVEKLNGEIKVESKEYEGTKFVVILPCEK